MADSGRSLMTDPMETFVLLTFRRRGVQRVATDERSVHDVTLIDGLARAFYWQRLLDTGAIAVRHGSAKHEADSRVGQRHCCPFPPYSRNPPGPESWASRPNLQSQASLVRLLLNNPTAIVFLWGKEPHEPIRFHRRL